MRILYIHQYFKTPYEPGATRSYWIAKELVAQGHTVIILTTKNKSKIIETANIDGIEVIYIGINYSNKMNVLRRLLSFCAFMFVSCLYCLFSKKIDLIYATSTPLTVGVPALLTKKMKKIPYIFEVRDLWPEVPIQLGVIKNRIIITLLRYYEKIVYKNAIHIIALSPGMYSAIASKESIEKISMIPNMAKIEIFYPREKDNMLYKMYHINEDSFKIVYFGALGRANGIKYIIEYARILIEKNITDIEFVVLGEGYEKCLIQKACNELTNIKYLGNYDIQITSNIVNICDIAIVSFNNIEVLNTNSPNKLFDALSAGKPIIVNSNGWTKTLVENNHCGIYLDPNKPLQEIKKIIDIKNDKERYLSMCQNARKLAVERYDKQILCKSISKLINNYEEDK